MRRSLSMRKISKSFYNIGSIALLTLAPLWGQEIVDRVVAVVNKEAITLYDIEKAKAFVHLQAELTDPESVRSLPTNFPEILESLIEETLLNQEAEKEGIDADSKEVDQAIDHILQQQGWDIDELIKTLKLRGLTLRDYRDAIAQQIVRFRLISKRVRSEIQIDESDLQNYYRSHKREFSLGEKWHLQQILVGDMESAERVLQRLDEGANFSDLARGYSIGPAKESGGDLGLLKKSDLLPELARAVEGLKPGEVSEPVQTSAGVHILRLVDHIEDDFIPFSEVKRRIQERLFQEESGKILKRYLQSLKESAIIERHLKPSSPTEP